MKKNKGIMKRVCLSATLIVGILGSVMTANAESFTTTGGEYNKTWNVLLYSVKHGGVFYRLTGTAEQPQQYKFDDVSITVTQYCNTANNVVSTDKARNAYKLSTCTDALTSISNGKGTALITVSDDTYGKGSIRIYN